MPETIIQTVAKACDTVTEQLYDIEHLMMDGGFGPISGIVNAENALLANKGMPEPPTLSLTKLGIGPSTLWHYATPDDIPARVPFVSMYKTAQADTEIKSSATYGVSSAMESPIGLGVLPYISTTSGIPSTVDRKYYISTDDVKEYQTVSYLNNAFPLAPKGLSKIGSLSIRNGRVSFEHSGLIPTDPPSAPDGPPGVLSSAYYPIPTLTGYLMAVVVGSSGSYYPASYDTHVYYDYSMYRFSRSQNKEQFKETPETISQNNIPTISNYYGQMISPMQTHYDYWKNNQTNRKPTGITMAPFLAGHGRSYDAPYLPFTNALTDSIQNHVVRAYRLDAPVPPDGTVLLEHEYTGKDLNGSQKTYYAQYYPVANIKGTTLEVPQVLRGTAYMPGKGDFVYLIQNIGFVPEIIQLTSHSTSILMDTLTFRNDHINQESSQSTRIYYIASNASTQIDLTVKFWAFGPTTLSIQRTVTLLEGGSEEPAVDLKFLDYLIIGRSGPIDDCYLIEK